MAASAPLNLGRSRESRKTVRPGAAGRAALGRRRSRARSAMAPRILPLVKFLAKGTLAGTAVYVVYDQGLLRGGEQGARALQKAKEAVPPAFEEWMKYFGWQLPAVPKTEISFCNTWNSGVRTVVGALSVAPTRAIEYTQDGWKYMKDLVK